MGASAAALAGSMYYFRRRAFPFTTDDHPSRVVQTLIVLYSVPLHAASLDLAWPRIHQETCIEGCTRIS